MVNEKQERLMLFAKKKHQQQLFSWGGKWLQRLLSLRYSIQITGLDKIEPDPARGTIFLPNHPAYIDPVIVITALYKKFSPRPLSDAEQVRKPIVRQVMKVIRPITIPDIGGNGRGRAAKVRAGLTEVVKKLNDHEEIIMYPAGRLYRSMYEDLGGNSGVEYILKHAPETRIILVRTSGLWGSSFSRAQGRLKPVKTLVSSVLFSVANLFFFGPKRSVTIEIVEDEIVHTLGSRHQINSYLERFYNSTAQQNTTVPLYWWQGRAPRLRPEP